MSRPATSDSAIPHDTAPHDTAPDDTAPHETAQAGPRTTGSTATLPTTAVILAGGTGTRIGMSMPKQLLKVAGKSILEHTIALFDEADGIDEVFVLMTPDFVDDAQAIVDRAGFQRVRPVLAGGNTRSATTQIALDALGDTERNVLFHDAVRPLLEERTIAACIAALDEYEAVDVAILSADTVIVTENQRIVDIPSRDRLRRGQTPQGFRLSTIRRAYELAAADPDFAATDDCSVVLKYLPDVPIFVVDGSEQNMKITHPIDVFIADKLFQLSSREAPPPRAAAEYTEAFAGRTAVVLGGSYGIGADIATMLRGFGADVFTFSRSQNDVHVQNPDDVERALAGVHAQTGRIDYVILTAGVLHRGALATSDHAEIREAIEVNFVAPVYVARAAIGYLAETQGQLLLFTSSSYTRGRADYSVYSSTKAAVVNLTQALAEEWIPLRVRVNCINPERTSTPMRSKAFGQEPAGSLLSSPAVALTSIDVLLAQLSGEVVDVRRVDAAPTGRSRTAREAELIAEALADAESDAAAEAAESVAHAEPA